MKALSKLFKYTAVALLSITLISCKKDDDSAKTQCLISQFNSSYETVCPDETYTGSGTSTFVYDNENRIVRWIDAWGEGDIVFTYDNNGRVSTVSDNWRNYHLTWEGNSVTVQSIQNGIPGNWKSVMVMNSSNELIRIDHYYKYNDIWVKEYYVLLTWQNGNITKAEEYSLTNNLKRQTLRSDIFSGKLESRFNKYLELKASDNAMSELESQSFELDYLFTFTYDSKRNPFAVHESLRVFHGFYAEGFFGFFLSANNPVFMKETHVKSGNEYTINLSWEYNKNDFPYHLILTDLEDDCLYTSQISFIYLNCQ